MMLTSSSANYNLQPFTCVIDPTLALLPCGVSLVKQLGKVMELWVCREFWHIIENSDYYLQQPELITSKGDTPEKTLEQWRTVEETLCSLKKWQKFRMANDLVGLNLFWLGDSPGNSYIPKNRNLEIFWRWEFMASLLDNQISQLQTKNYILPLAFRDTIALAASLESAFILTHQPPSGIDKNFPPEICKALEAWNISCQALTHQDSFVAMERNYLRKLLIQTNTAKFVWGGVHLTVLHLLISSTENLILPKQSQRGSLSVIEALEDDLRPQSCSWLGARVFWYTI